jgi:DNA-binding MarR family transcriptional regulator
VPSPTTTAELSSTLRIGVMRLARRLRNERADYSLSLNQLAVLATLDRHGPLTPRELAGAREGAASVDDAHPGRAGAARAGEPHSAPVRRRQVLMANTGEAGALLREDRRRRDVWLSRRLAELTAAERATLRDAARILDRIAQA